MFNVACSFLSVRVYVCVCECMYMHSRRQSWRLLCSVCAKVSCNMSEQLWWNVTSLILVRKLDPSSRRLTCCVAWGTFLNLSFPKWQRKQISSTLEAAENVMILQISDSVLRGKRPEFKSGISLSKACESGQPVKLFLSFRIFQMGVVKVLPPRFVWVKWDICASFSIDLVHSSHAACTGCSPGFSAVIMWKLILNCQPVYK